MILKIILLVKVITVNRRLLTSIYVFILKYLQANSKLLSLLLTFNKKFDTIPIVNRGYYEKENINI